MSTWLPILPINEDENERTGIGEPGRRLAQAEVPGAGQRLLPDHEAGLQPRAWTNSFTWFGQEPRPGFTKATVSAWRVALEARGLGAVSINVRITAVRKLAVEAADNGLLAPELANGITRVKGVKSKGVRLGNWLTVRQAQTLLNTPDISTKKGLRDRAILAVLLGCGLRRSEVAALTFGHVQQRDGRWCIVDLLGQARPRADDTDADLGQGGDRRLDGGRQRCRGPRVPPGEPRRPGARRSP